MTPERTGIEGACAHIGIIMATLLAFAASAGAQPEIASDQSKHDFGSARTGTEVGHTFTIRNAGDEPLVIEKVKPACGCTVAELENKVLAPGASTNLEVFLSLKNRTGSQRKSVTVISNDPDTPRFKLWLLGEATEVVSVNPKTLLFGQITPPPPEVDVRAPHVDTDSATGTAVQDSKAEASVTKRQSEIDSAVGVVTRHIDVVVTDPEESVSVTGVRIAVPSDRRSTAQCWRADYEEVAAGTAYRVTVACAPETGMRGQLRATLIIETDHAEQSRLRVPLSAVVAEELSVTPRDVVLLSTDRDVTRYVVVSKGPKREDAFEITKVTPPSDAVSVSVRPAGKRGYVVQLSGFSATDPAAEGGEVLIETDVPEMPRISLPIRIENLEEVAG